MKQAVSREVAVTLVEKLKELKQAKGLNFDVGIDEHSGFYFA